MPVVRKNALVSYSAEAMFDLVADVERYPQFLPWCAASEIQSRSETGVVATLRISFHGIAQSFTTANTLQRPNRIDLKLRDGPFSRLDGVWTFKPLTESACRVDLELDYEMRSGLVAQMLGPVFGQIAQTMVDAFVSRAERLHGS